MMENNSNTKNSYSGEELLEFKELINQKLKSSKEQLKSFTDRAENISEVSGNDGDWIDDSSNMQDLEMLNRMIIRQQKHIQDLEFALLRIRNNRFGICVVSGQLIDKRRLMAVPTTTKSLEAKINISEKKEVPKKKKVASSKAPTSFSRIIKRTGGTPAAKPAKEKDNYFFDEADDEADDLDLSFEESTNIIDDSIEENEE